MATIGNIIVNLQANSAQFGTGLNSAKGQLRQFQGEVSGGFIESLQGVHHFMRQVARTFAIFEVIKTGIKAIDVAIVSAGDSTKNWADVLQDTIKSIPLLGEAYDVGDKLSEIAQKGWNKLFGDGKYKTTAEIEAQTKATEKLAAAREKLVHISERAKFAADTLGMSGTDKQLAEIEHRRKEAIAAAREANEKGLSPAVLSQAIEQINKEAEQSRLSLGRKLKEQLETPKEKFIEVIKEYQELFDKKLIGSGLLDRALKEARKKYVDSFPENKPGTASTEFRFKWQLPPTNDIKTERETAQAEALALQKQQLDEQKKTNSILTDNSPIEVDIP